MQIKKGNVAVIAIIVVIIAITAGVVGWMFAKKLQAPAPQPVATQQQPTSPVAQTQTTQPTQQVAPVTKSQTSDETASWQTFTNAKFGFSIKYPTGYVAKIGDETKSFDPSFYISNPAKKEVNGIVQNYALELNYNLKFLHGSNGTYKTPEEWFAGEKFNGEKLTQTQLAGKTVYTKKLKLGSVDSTEYDLFTLNDNDTYDLYQIIIRNDDLGDKVLSTLVFLK